MLSSMLEKLEAVERRFVELEHSLSREGLDGRELTRLSKERANLAEIVEAFRRFKELEKREQGARELLGEQDPDLRTMAKVELDEVKSLLEESERELVILTLPSDPNDAKNCMVEIRAGTGGEEAALFVADLLRMYTRYSGDKGWRTEVLSSTPASAGGLKEVIMMVEGLKVFSRLKFESGVHRVQRVPATEAQGRIHTSAVTVAILPEADEVEVSVNPGDLEISVFRSSGAGGQSVNTADSAVRIVHRPSGIVVECQDERSQLKNKDRAMKILKARLLEKAQAEQHAAISATRKSLVGSGDRSERIRTYNFPQGRVTDHRINLTLYSLPEFINGKMDEMLDALGTHHQTELLKQELEQAP
ncbi:MAG: peptide chain release factor 1 [Pseudomonadota bacterium]|jgi:peptide chain release factor 1